MRSGKSDRGAAAVEFALVFPLVIMLLLCVIEFSRLWNIQATISDGARISARFASLHSDEADVVNDAKDEARAIPGFVDWSTASIDVTPDCAGGSGVATTTITVSPGSVSEWFSTALGSPIKLTATGRMPCGG